MWWVSKIEAKSTLQPCHPAGQGKNAPVDRPSKNNQGWGARLKQARGRVVSSCVGRQTVMREACTHLRKILPRGDWWESDDGSANEADRSKGMSSGINGCPSPSLDALLLLLLLLLSLVSGKLSLHLIVSRAVVPLSHGNWARQDSPVEDGGGSGRLGTASIVHGLMADATRLGSICMGARAPWTVGWGMFLATPGGQCSGSIRNGARVFTPERALAAPRWTWG